MKIEATVTSSTGDRDSKGHRQRVGSWYGGKLREGGSKRTAVYTTLASGQVVSSQPRYSRTRGAAAASAGAQRGAGGQINGGEGPHIRRVIEPSSVGSLSRESSTPHIPPSRNAASAASRPQSALIRLAGRVEEPVVRILRSSSRPTSATPARADHDRAETAGAKQEAMMEAPRSDSPFSVGR
jgi:hypothetical protein